MKAIPDLKERIELEATLDAVGHYFRWQERFSFCVSILFYSPIVIIVLSIWRQWSWLAMSLSLIANVAAMFMFAALSSVCQFLIKERIEEFRIARVRNA